MASRDPILLEDLLFLYIIFFSALFFESGWFIAPDGTTIDVAVWSIWTTAISGLLIAILTVRQWKTNRPVPVTWMGLGLGAMTLGMSIFSFELLLGSYLNTKIIVLLWTALFLLIVGLVCVIKELIDGIKQVRRKP